MTSIVRVESAAPYDVVIGSGVATRAADLVPSAAERVAIVFAPSVVALVETISASLAARGVTILPLPLPDAEAAKTAQVAADCWRALGEAGFTRSDAVVGVGGGATTDLSGFVAATWLRGVAHVAVPTTLLGMVDAAVGGKTGINTDEGKNLVGAFHEPAGVLCDLDSLASLTRHEYVQGLAEIAKCGLINDERILDILEADPAGASLAGGEHEAELVRRAVQVKARVVAVDLRESTSTGSGEGSASGLPTVGGREALNYGHTLGHAIEQAEGYRWRHGDAISVGMVFVADLAARLGVLDAAAAQRHRALLSSLGLPTSYQGHWSSVRSAMSRDKKARGTHLRLVLLEAIGAPVLLADPDENAMVASFAALSA